jgi:hypothetical protein
VSTDTTLTWVPVDQIDEYVVRWRRTDDNAWTESKAAGNCVFVGAPRAPKRDAAGNSLPPEHQSSCQAVLKGIRVDDWVFGVSSVSKDGFESPVASAVPGGAFKPYVAAPAAPVK